MSKAAKKRKLLTLIRKYVSGTANEREKVFVEKYYHYFENKEIFAAGLSENEQEDIKSRMLANIHFGIDRDEAAPVIRFYHKTYAKIAAAAVLLLFIAGGIFYSRPKEALTVSSLVAVQQDINPGVNGAILKLPGGKTIVLDTVQNGRILSQAGNAISKTDSTVRFDAVSPSKTVEYYTLITPRGRQEKIILADGTKVWLNAGSSIRFPNAFPGAKRTVEITGEIFFEVAKKAHQPFVVSVNDVRIDVLGTAFNVKAYPGEQKMKTTLLEGAVKVTKGTDALVLRPGQEALISNDEKMHLIGKANLNEAIAWRDNLFWFERDNVHTVMKTLSRWYDVDIIVKGNIPDLFTGSMPRDITFSKVFELLQKTGGIHYKIENGKVIVTP